MCIRNSDHIAIELKSIAAFDTHVPRIQSLARDDNGEGSEVG